ncbi:hypothetical protein J968_4339, partial [Acinetobacter baumannii 26016_2]
MSQHDHATRTKASLLTEQLEEQQQVLQQQQQER